MRTTNIKFTGLASGLDTAAIVESLIMPDKLKVDSKKQDQALLQLRKDSWRDMNKTLMNFYDNQIGKLRMGSNFENKRVSVSNSNILDVTSNGSLPTGTHSIEVKNLATGGRVNTEKMTYVDSAGNGATKSTTLKELMGAKDGDTFDIEINGEMITLYASDTLEGVAKEIQEKAPDWNVNFDEGVGAFFLSSKKTGQDTGITIGGDVELLKKLGIADQNGKVDVKDGVPATITYNGMEITSDSNNITVNGINMTLKAESKGEVVTLVVEQDTESIMDTIVGFVDEYNKLIEELHTKMGADKAKDYKPLTEEQKSQMTDREIEQWEQKIKDGIFSGDKDLEQLTSTMREVLGSTISGNAFGSLAEIGITTGNWKENGKLIIDEKKLRAAIEKDSEAVVELFAGGSGQDGLIDKLYTKIGEEIKSTSMNSAYSFYNDKILDEKITDMKKEVKKLEERMWKREDMYYKKFTAMERMMSQLNNQSSWLSGQLGGM